MFRHYIVCMTIWSTMYSYSLCNVQCPTLTIVYCVTFTTIYFIYNIIYRKYKQKDHFYVSYIVIYIRNVLLKTISAEVIFPNHTPILLEWWKCSNLSLIQCQNRFASVVKLRYIVRYWYNQIGEKKNERITTSSLFGAPNIFIPIFQFNCETVVKNSIS